MAWTAPPWAEPRTRRAGWRKASTTDSYGFTVEDLDFILNYDIKYRMGRDAGNAGEEED